MFSFSAEVPDITPLFAREAAQYLYDGDIQRAMEICARGTAAFPQYATGYFVFGKCYEALGQTVESLVQYRRALAILPDNTEVGLLVKHAEEKEQGKNIEPKKEPIPVDEFLVEKPLDEQSGIEYLAKRLQDVKRIQPLHSPEAEPDSIHIDNEKRFVTATMADIYASQGAYAEAIKAYTEIMKQHPEGKERFENRIQELEELRANQQRDKRLEGVNNKKAS